MHFSAVLLGYGRAAFLFRKGTCFFMFLFWGPALGREPRREPRSHTPKLNIGDTIGNTWTKKAEEGAEEVFFSIISGAEEDGWEVRN